MTSLPCLARGREWGWTLTKPIVKAGKSILMLKMADAPVLIVDLQCHEPHLRVVRHRGTWSACFNLTRGEAFQEVDVAVIHVVKGRPTSRPDKRPPIRNRRKGVCKLNLRVGPPEARSDASDHLLDHPMVVSRCWALPIGPRPIRELLAMLVHREERGPLQDNDYTFKSAEKDGYSKPNRRQSTCRRSTKGVVLCKSQIVVANDAVGELSKVRRAYATVSAAKQFVHEGQHDWHHDYAGKTFLTDVDVRRGLPSAAYHALTEDLRPTKGVRRLGPDEYVVTAEHKQMPSYIALPLINDAILRSAPFCTDPREQRFWWAHIASDDFQSMLCDAFYFTIANVVQTEAAQRNLAGITSLEGSAQFQRIACNYVSMLKRIPKERKRSFEDHFDEVLSYAILLCLHAGFPGQLDKLKTPEFCQRVLDMCTEWLRGLRPSRNARDRVRGAWIRRSLFGASTKGRMGKLPEAQEGLTSGRVADTSRERYVGQSTRRLKYTLHHTPVVEQYMLLNEGRVGMPHLAARLTLTEDPSVSMRNMGLTAEEVGKLRGRIVTGKRRYVPDIPTLLKCAIQEQQRLHDEHVQQVEAHRKSILDVRQGKFEYTSSKPVSQELHALISARDTHEISNYVLTKFTRLARCKAAKVLK